MSLVDHLFELRGRVVKSLLAIAVAFAVIFFFAYDPIFDIVLKPYCDLPVHLRGDQPGDCRLIILGVADSFLLKLRVTMICALVVSAPIWLYQVWAFITPGLYAREKKWAAPFILSSTALFAVGMVLAYFTLNKGLDFLLGFAGDGIDPQLVADRYINYVIFMLLAFGVSFEFPLLLIFSNLAGILPASRLKAWRRGMYFGIAVFAAVITPSGDPFSFFALAVPMFLFYELAVLFARLRERARRRRGPVEGDTDQWSDDEVSPL